MTAHSPEGLEPERFNVVKQPAANITFANNDVAHLDPTGTDHEAFSFGLRKALFNYMHNIGLDDPLGKWFEHKVPKTKIAPGFIQEVLNEPELPLTKPSTKIVWTGIAPSVEFTMQSKKGNQRELA